MQWVGLHLFYSLFWGNGALPTQPATLYIRGKEVCPRWILKAVSYHATKVGFDALRGKDLWLVSSKADWRE